MNHIRHIEIVPDPSRVVEIAGGVKVVFDSGFRLEIGDYLGRDAPSLCLRIESAIDSTGEWCVHEVARVLQEVLSQSSELEAVLNRPASASRILAG